MNIIINGFLDRKSFPIVRRLFSVLEIDSFVYTFDSYKPDFGKYYSKGILLNWRKINFYSNYNVNFNELEPLDEEIISSMRKCEVVVMKMMDRLETLKNYSYGERKELYLNHLRYWNDLIGKKKIDFFLSQNVPHETSDYVCYCLCKLRKIPTIILFQTHIPDTCIICNDWENSDYGLIKQYKKLKTLYSNKKPDEVKLSLRFEKYYQLQTNTSMSIEPFYMEKKPVVKTGVKKISSIYSKLKKDPKVYFEEAAVIARTLIRRSISFFNTKNLMGYYERKCIEFNDKNKYIFVALHLQPEMSTSPRADAYVDQLLIVQMLSAYLPKDIKILVKEHPYQKALGRTKKFYHSLLGLPNVRLISRKISSRDLINNCLAVATCVGLAGFEALFQNKPVLMFGHDFYQYSPGVFSIRTNTDLKEAIKKILAGPTFSATDFRIFLKALDAISTNGSSDSDYSPTSSLTESENTKNIADAIIKNLKDIKK